MACTHPLPKLWESNILEKICLEGPEDFDFGELGVVVGGSIFPVGRQRIFGENKKMHNLSIKKNYSNMLYKGQYVLRS